MGSGEGSDVGKGGWKEERGVEKWTIAVKKEEKEEQEAEHKSTVS